MKKILIAAIFFILILSIPAISATDNIKDDIVSTDYVIEDMEIVDNSETDIVSVQGNTSILSGNDYGNAESGFVPANNNGKSDIINPSKNNGDSNAPETNVVKSDEVSKDVIYYIEDKFETTDITYNSNMVFKFNLQSIYPYSCDIFVYKNNFKDYSDYIDDLYDLIPNGNYLTLKKSYAPGSYLFVINCYHDTNYMGEDSTGLHYPVEILEDFGPDGYKYMKIENYKGYYDEGIDCEYSWKGVFDGYLKIYKGSKVINTLRLRNSKGANDGLGFFTPCLPVGTYKAKIIDKKGKVAAQSTIKILKTPTKIKVKTITVKPGSKKTIYAHVYGKGGTYYSGYVKFTIMGKTLNVKIKDGVAKVTVKIPNKIKKYSCKATFLGDSNAKGSSTTFKIIAKKTIKFTVVVPTKLNQKITRAYGKYKVQTYKWIEYNSNSKVGHIKITVYKNGKKLTYFKSKYYVHYSSGGGSWNYNNYEGFKTTQIGYKDFLKAYKVTAIVWV